MPVQQKLATALDLLQHGQSGEGEALLREAVAEEPANAEVLMHLGLLTLRSNRVAEAERLFARMATTAPESAVPFNGQGIALAGLGRLDEAIACFDRALALNPRDADVWANRGLALTDLPRWEEALENYAQALSFRPDFPAVHKNAGLALHRLGRYREAIGRYDLALAADPDDAQAHFNRSLSLLAPGEYDRGWAEYEWRWRSVLAHADAHFPAPRWLGDFPVEGKTVLVHAEQGLGDTLQFCRYVPMLAQQARVVVVAPKPLARLLSSLDGVADIVMIGDPLPPFDAWIPMMSLPLAFRTSVETIPRAVPYLHADPERVSAWTQRLKPLPGRKIGLVWAGAPRVEDVKSAVVDRRRSMRLEQFAALASVRGVSIVSLQKGVAAAWTKAPPAGLVVHDWTDELTDFADTAALIGALDLVISVDTSVAHLAGALGKPVWILNRFDQCWRWLHGRADSPWYPTARLFRQTSPGEWSDVMRDIVAALQKFE